MKISKNVQNHTKPQYYRVSNIKLKFSRKKVDKGKLIRKVNSK